MKPAKHGTRSKYTTGCRCSRCSKANRDYQRDYMARSYKPVSSWGAGDQGYVRVDGSVRFRRPEKAA